MNNLPSLESVARALLARGKGILAADESLPTIGKRFAALKIPSTEENRRAYRELLFTAPGLGEGISGVILFDETIHQSGARGGPLPEILRGQGIVPGIKVDAGTIDLAKFPGEKVTGGLDGLKDRLRAYRALGAQFAKWRAVISIGDGLPTRTALETNARVLALYAAECQEAGVLPIVEPEVLMDGDHAIDRCEEVTRSTLQAVFAALAEHRVELKEMLLKSGMVLSGKDCPQPANVAQVAEATLRCLRASVPPTVPGIVFLSGGQTDVAATERLNAICGAGSAPWALTFSFGRALQDAAMTAWSGSPARSAAAQSALLHRIRCNALALDGKYSTGIEQSSGLARADAGVGR